MSGAQPMALLVAPYTPGAATAHLGAAKKIEGVARLLHRLGYAIHLVDSSHSSAAFAPEIHDARRELAGLDVAYSRPFCMPSRKLGKLFNVFLSRRLFERLAATGPALVWAYNSYAFEARLALHLQRSTACTLVLELEDLPLARRRGLNPKPALDQLYFRRFLRQADLVTFVNATLQARHAAHTRRALLFPSILSDALTTQPIRRRFLRPPFRLGYFGGLEPDKGVRTLLELLPRLPADWKVTVTGAGSLEPELARAQTEFPQRLQFHGAVSHSRVVELMHGCDCIVNPHAPIAAMGDGVFPFKVCEAIASGALLISTPLPSIDVDLSASTSFFDGSSNDLLRAVSAAKERYDAAHPEIRTVRDVICARYGEAAMLEQLRCALVEAAIGRRS